jgi:hypothetical protein
MPIDVLTNRYNSSRTGANLQETTLTTANVNVNDFGKLFARNVDGQMYAQPLIVSGLTVTITDSHGNKTPAVKNTVFAATSRNWVYAYDAEDPAACDPFWSRNLGTPVSARDYDNLDNAGVYRDFSDEIGITSTPVIDPGAEIIYVVAKSKTNGTYSNKLHALKLGSGDELPGSPVEITATVAGTGSDTAAGKIKFNAKMHLNRPGLLLLGGVIYIAFGSQGDREPYHGWIFAYDAATLAQVAVYCTTPNWGEGGIWQSGCGLAGDTDGEVFAVCGNGDAAGPFVNAPNFGSGPVFGESVLRLKLDKNAKTLTVADWFTPFNAEILNQNDTDLCAGPVLLPWDNLVGAWGKDRTFYIMKRGNMGHFNPANNSQIVQADVMTNFHIHCAPVMFDGPRGPVAYVWSEEDRLLAYAYAGKFQKPPFSFSAQPAPHGMPGGMLSISSNGKTQGTGIVWASVPSDANGNQEVIGGTLRAFDAGDLNAELWNSDHDPTGADAVGNFAKFCPPVVANGKIYLSTFSNELLVYGILPIPHTSNIGPWSQANVSPPGTPLTVEGTASVSCGRFTVVGSGHDIWDPADGFHYVYQNLGAASTITGRVISVQDVSPWSKAGVMIRESLDPASPHAMVVMTPGNGAALQYRPAQGAPMVHVPFAGTPPLPVWVRVKSAIQAGGMVITGFVSADGTNWHQVGVTPPLAIDNKALAGIAVTAHSDGTPNPRLRELCVAILDRMTLA